VALAAGGGEGIVIGTGAISRDSAKLVVVYGQIFEASIPVVVPEANVVRYLRDQ
jgi:hypothetical protein